MSSEFGKPYLADWNDWLLWFSGYFGYLDRVYNDMRFARNHGFIEEWLKCREWRWEHWDQIKMVEFYMRDVHFNDLWMNPVL